MKKFNKIYIEIGNICNLSCSFCSIDNRIKKTMSIDEFSTVVDKIKDYTDTIYLHVKGEPLLHPELENILKIAKNNNLKVNITTNGTLIDKKKDILIHNPVNKIFFSLHSENDKASYLKDIFDASDELSKTTTIIYRLWTLQSGKLDDKSVEIVNELTKRYNLSTEVVDKIYNENNIKIADNIYLDKDNEFEWPSDIKSDVESMGFCMALKTQIAILVDGTVVPCCLDSKGEINLGNIFSSSMEEIINSKRFIDLKKSFGDRKPCEELCRKCTYKERFK